MPGLPLSNSGSHSFSEVKGLNVDRVSGDELEYRGEDARYYYLDEPFTGLAFWLGADGQVRAEQEFRHGLEWGLGRKWNAARTLTLEAVSYRGVYHGVARKWHSNGQLAEECLSELGICLSRRRWDEQGRLIEDYQLQPTHMDTRLLQLHRSQFPDAPPISISTT